MKTMTLPFTLSQFLIGFGFIGCSLTWVGVYFDFKLFPIAAMFSVMYFLGLYCSEIIRIPISFKTNKIPKTDEVKHG